MPFVNATAINTVATANMAGGRGIVVRASEGGRE